MQEKKCSRCKDYKLIKHFTKCSRSKDGYYYICKECQKIVAYKYKTTKKGLVTAIYGGQRYGCRLRRHKYPTYTRNELYKWLDKQQLFHELYDNWSYSGYKKNLRPSCDRKDDYKSYTLDNIQLMTWGENKQKGHADRRNGINNKRSVSVIQYDLNNNFKKEYYSTMQAERETGVNHANIYSACVGRLKTAGKFIWKLKNNNND